MIKCRLDCNSTSVCEYICVIHCVGTAKANRVGTAKANRESCWNRESEPRKHFAKRLVLREASRSHPSRPQILTTETSSVGNPAVLQYISTLPCYHIIDYYGTNYQVACSSPGKSDDAIDKLLNGWLQWAGAPVEIHTESRTEFTSKELVTFLMT